MDSDTAADDLIKTFETVKAARPKAEVTAHHQNERFSVQSIEKGHGRWVVLVAPRGDRLLVDALRIRIHFGA